VKVQDLSLKDIARNIKTEAEAETLLSELRRFGWVKSYILKETPAADLLTSFLKTFWDWEKSPYINEKRRKNHSIHKRYCRLNEQAVALYWEPFFKGRFLGEITARDITAFINDLGKKPISASRKNGVIKAGTKALRWAFSQEIIEKDPAKGHILFSGEERKRNILNPNAAEALFKVVWKEERAKLANMLASVTGMRSGEILALRFQDIGPDCLYVRSAWNRLDGIKLPKNNETRTVEVPFPYLIEALTEQAKKNPWGFSPDSFVFWSDFHKTKPMEGYIFVDGLREALVLIGFTKDEAAKYLFHGWRHFFTAYMVRKLDKKLLKSQTGHKTDDMIELYGDHEIVGDRATIQAMTKETFARLIPEPPKKILLLEYKPMTAAA
jgi:integrase